MLGDRFKGPTSLNVASSPETSIPRSGPVTTEGPSTGAMASALQREEDDSSVVLDLVGMELLPPLSPTMQRAFLEAFGDEGVSEESQEAQTVSFSQGDAATSPSLEARWQDGLTTMSPSKELVDESPETKRARRSAIEKKSRQRRQSVLRRMRQEVAQLENLYDEVTKRQKAAGQVAQLSVGKLRHKFSQLSLVTQALEEDRARLLKVLESHEAFQRTAEAMASRGDGRQEAREHQSQQGERVWDTGVPPSSSFRVRMRHRSPAECYELVRETYETIKRFDDGGHFASTGANFMGWTDKRKIDEARSLQYGFAKTFPLESAEGLLLRTWDVFCHADSMAHLSFNASVTTRFEMVQTLGDDLCIIRRDHKMVQMPINFVTVHVVFRLQTPMGFTLCMRTIPTPELKSALEPHEFYYDVFHWYVGAMQILMQRSNRCVASFAPRRTHFNQLFDADGRPAGCAITTGGYIADVKQLVSKYWLFELVMSVLRWESTCVALLFLKQA
jgi:hypothetical protein